MNEPYDDETMVYDRAAHRYTLTPQCVLRELGIDLSQILNTGGDANPSTAPKRALNEVSMRVYQFIYSHTAQKMYVEYLLAKYAPCRDVLKQCMINELQYVSKNGDFFNHAGINLAKGTAMQLADLRGRMVSPYTIDLLNQEMPNGVCLLYRGWYNVPYNLKYREDY